MHSATTSILLYLDLELREESDDEDEEEDDEEDDLDLRPLPRLLRPLPRDLDLERELDDLKKKMCKHKSHELNE